MLFGALWPRGAVSGALHCSDGGRPSAEAPGFSSRKWLWCQVPAAAVAPEMGSFE